MPLLETGAVAAEAMRVAEAAVRATWVARQKVLSGPEQAQMQDEVRAAGLDALFLHITQNAVVAGIANSPCAAGGAAAVMTAGSIT
jgi:hypothetical protein